MNRNEFPKVESEKMVEDNLTSEHIIKLAKEKYGIRINKEEAKAVLDSIILLKEAKERGDKLFKSVEEILAERIREIPIKKEIIRKFKELKTKCKRLFPEATHVINVTNEDSADEILRFYLPRKEKWKGSIEKRSDPFFEKINKLIERVDVIIKKFPEIDSAKGILRMSVYIPDDETGKWEILVLPVIGFSPHKLNLKTGSSSRSKTLDVLNDIFFSKEEEARAYIKAKEESSK